MSVSATATIDGEWFIVDHPEDYQPPPVRDIPSPLRYHPLESKDSNASLFHNALVLYNYHLSDIVPYRDLIRSAGHRTKEIKMELGEKSRREVEGRESDSHLRTTAWGYMRWDNTMCQAQRAVP